MKLVRAFISIELPKEIIEEVVKVQKFFNKINYEGKVIEKENLHLTLKFLGEIEEDKINEIIKKLSEIKFKEFNCSLGEVGVFSYKDKPRIVWIKVNGEVMKLQKEIDNSLSELFQKEQRFMSHLTIARIKNVDNLNQFYQKAKDLAVANLSFKVNSFKLKESELKKSGPVYKTIKSFESKS